MQPAERYGDGLAKLGKVHPMPRPRARWRGLVLAFALGAALGAAAAFFWARSQWSWMREELRGVDRMR